MLQLAWIADGEGQLIWFNHRWYEFTGTTPEEMSNGGWLKVHHPDYVEGVVAKFERSFARGETWEDTFPMRAADGSYGWFLSRAEPFRDKQERIAYWYGTCTDVSEQRQAALTTEHERRKLEAVLRSMRDAVIVADTRGRIVFLNPAAVRVVGFLDTKEMRGDLDSYAHIFEFALLDGTPLPLEQWPLARILRGESLSDLEVRGWRRDTRREWFFTCSGEPVRDETGRQYLGVLVLRDVTAQRRAEYRFRESAELLRAITSSTADVVFAKDRQGRFLLGNPALFAAVRRSEGEVIGRTDAELLANAQFAREIMEDDRRIMERGQAEVVEERDTAPDGSTRHWLVTKAPYRDNAGHVVGLLGIGRDITERKRMEEALRASEERFRVLAESMPQIVWTADAEGRVDYWNRRAIEYSGLPVEALHGAWEAVVHPEDLAPMTEAWLAAERAGREFAFEYRLRGRDGIYRWHLCRAVPLLEGAGRVGKWLGTSTDIEDQKAVERALEERVHERTEQLESQRIEIQASHADLAQLAHVASHDLQESLRMMASFAQLLERRYGGSLEGDAAEYIGYIVDGARRMQRQILSLLSYARVGHTEEDLAKADTGECARAALADLAGGLGEGGEVHIGALPRLLVRPRQIEQVFRHLLANALKFRRSEIALRIEIAAWRDGERWVFSVKDNGVGVDPHYCEHIFQLFQRLETGEEEKGTGIGLAICRRIVERHGGHIWLECSSGSGADFRFALPLAPR